MKRAARLFCLLLSVLILLIVQWIPFHHHHEGMACIAIEHCDGHTDCEGGHANHSSQTDNTLCSHCVDQAPFLASSSSYTLTPSDLHFIQHTFSSLYVALFAPSEEVDVQLPGDPLGLYRLTYIGGSNGLRAPPCSLS